ncbi:MAG: ArsR family transcriptional regulator [Rhodobacteraceae bacterium]|nr:ArsR family transcriptional regulator [Paracoccaceae bacterium]
MEHCTAATLLTTLGHEGRLQVFRLLMRRAPQSVRPGELVAALALKPATLSAYLAALQAAGLVQAERQGRAIHYRADTARLGTLITYLHADAGRARPAPLPEGAAPMPDRPLHVLFICTGNSARSIIVEALLRDLGAGRFVAHSAGTRPGSAPNPLALRVLEQAGHATAGLRSKPLTEFEGPAAPPLDFVFTVCDAAANEECPYWPGMPMTAHWGLPDPAAANGTEAEKLLAFAQTYRHMRRRIEAFVALPLTSLARLALQSQIDEIGKNGTA